VAPRCAEEAAATATLERDDFSSNRHPALAIRGARSFPKTAIHPGSSPGQAFSGSCSSFSLRSTHSAPLRRNTRRNPSRSPNARERPPRAEWAERNETKQDGGSMSSAWERHCLFRCGAFEAARARHSSIPYSGSGIPIPQPEHPNYEHSDRRLVPAGRGFSCIMHPKDTCVIRLPH
jgi:hypothetical protein